MSDLVDNTLHADESSHEATPEGNIPSFDELSDPGALSDVDTEVDDISIVHATREDIDNAQQIQKQINESMHHQLQAPLDTRTSPPPLTTATSRICSLYPSLDTKPSNTSLLDFATQSDSRISSHGISTHPMTTSSDHQNTSMQYANTIANNAEQRQRNDTSHHDVDNQVYSLTSKDDLVALLVSMLESANSMYLSSKMPPSLQTASRPSLDDSTGIGDRLAARSFVSAQLDAVFHNSSSSSVPDGQMSPNRKARVPTVLTKYLGIVAIGTSAGSVDVCMPSTSLSIAGPPRLFTLEDSSGQSAGPVTAIALGHHAGGLLLVTGHASGQLSLWETKSGMPGSNKVLSWTMAKALNGAHATAVTACSVIDGMSTTWILSADAHGRLMCHNVNRVLSLAAQALAGFARQVTGTTTASASRVLNIQAAGRDPGTILSLYPLHAARLFSATAEHHHHTTNNNTSTNSSKVFYLSRDGSQYILMIAVRAIMLCMLSPDGAIIVLHVFFPPRSAEGRVCGYAAWKIDEREDPTPSPSAAHTTPPLRASVAVAWGKTVSIYSATLTRPLPSSDRTQKEENATAPLPPPELISSFSTDGTIYGASFLAPLGALLLASTIPLDANATKITILHPRSWSGFKPNSESLSQQNADGKIYDAVKNTAINEESSELDAAMIESLILHDWMVGRQVDLPGESSYHASLSSSSSTGPLLQSHDQALLLGSRGVHVIHLMTWQQKLSTLVSMGRLDLALLCAVQLWYNATSDGNKENAMWPADAAVHAELDEISRQLLTILCAFLDATLSSIVHHRAPPPPPPPPPLAMHNSGHIEFLADIAIDCCLLLDRHDALFDDVAPRFLSSALDNSLNSTQQHRGQSTLHSIARVFLDRLTIRILNNALSHVPPEIVQALVDHFVAKSQVHKIEQCVIRMDILSLDLNQIIPLCFRYDLHAALIHIFNNAMGDYATPAVLLLFASMAAATSGGAGHPVGSAAGRAPREIGCPVEAVIVSQGAATTTAKLFDTSKSLQVAFKLLVYLRMCITGQAYPPESHTEPSLHAQHSMKVSCIAFLLYYTVGSLQQTWESWSSMVPGDTDIDVLLKRSSTDTAPCHDPYPVLRYICAVDVDATLCVLREGLSGWEALESDVFEVFPELKPFQYNDNSPNAPGGGCGGGEGGGGGGGERTITQAFVDAIVCLFLELHNDTRDAARAYIPSNLSHHKNAQLHFIAEHVAANRAVVRGPVMLCVLRYLAAPTAHGQHVDKSIERKKSMDKESIFKDIIAHSTSIPDEAIQLASIAGFKQVQSLILHKQKQYSHALDCLVRDEQHPDAPFKYIRDIYIQDVPCMTEDERKEFHHAAVHAMPHLVRINAKATVALVAECFAEHQIAIVDSLNDFADEQFAFLQAAIDAEQKNAVGLNGNGGSYAQADYSFGFKESFLSPLLENKRVSSLYVKLLCQFQQSAVLHFLQSHDSYEVDTCLQWCLQHGAKTAAAYLLERKGDITRAFSLYKEAIDEANDALTEAIYASQRPSVLLSFIHMNSKGSAIHSGNHPDTAYQPLQHLSKHHQDSILPQGFARVHQIGSVEESSAREADDEENSIMKRCFDDAVHAMHNGLTMCARLTQDNVPKTRVQRDDTAANTTAWLQVLHHFVDKLREIHQRHSNEVQGEGVHEEHILVLKKVFTFFLEDVIRNMTGYVPLQSIASSIIEKYQGDRLGQFRDTLLGLLSACLFELQNLRCSTRVTGVDAIGLLKKGYKQCMKPLVVFSTENDA